MSGNKEVKVRELCNMLGDDMVEVKKYYDHSLAMELSKNNSFYELSAEELSNIWNPNIANAVYPESIISPERQSLIIAMLSGKLELFIESRAEILEETKIKSGSSEIRREPVWYSLNIADINGTGGIRLQAGLRTGGCEYRKNDKHQIGCFNCGFFVAGVSDILPGADDFLTQFKRILSKVNHDIKKRHMPQFQIIEFPNDGSFLNENEIPIDAANKIFQQISMLSNVKRVMIETRPEYIEKERLDALTSLLRPDQSLEIGIGLETTDPFILQYSIHKGYSKQQYEKAIETISKTDKCSVFVYSIFKPAFLNEEEAINNAVKTARYIDKIKKRYNVESYIKCEPAVVARGTLLEVLYDTINSEGKRLYEPPSYWSVAELIARLFDEKLEKSLRIGARENMDWCRSIPALYYRNGMLSRFDYLLYDSIQQFNNHKNIDMLLADIEKVFFDSSYFSWAKKISKKRIFELRSERNTEIKSEIVKKRFIIREEFLSSIRDVLDTIEYGQDVQQFAANVKDRFSEYERDKKIGDMIKNIILEAMPDTKIAIGNLDFLNDKLKLLRMEIDIHNIETNSFHSIWLNIPTKRHVSISEVAGEYDAGREFIK